MRTQRNGVALADQVVGPLGTSPAQEGGWRGHGPLGLVVTVLVILVMVAL